MDSKKLIEKMVEDNATTALDSVKDKLDSTEFKVIADKMLNNIEETFTEGGLADRIAENVTGRIRARFGIADSNLEN